MSELRARRDSKTMAIPSKAALEDRPLLATPNMPIPKYQRTPPPPRRPTRALNISISLFILACVVLYAQRSTNKSKKAFQSGGKRLPDWYAICSREGQKVYTVPVDGIGATECVVIGGKEVQDTGSLGASVCSSCSACSSETRSFLTYNSKLG